MGKEMEHRLKALVAKEAQDWIGKGASSVASAYGIKGCVRSVKLR